MGTLVMILESCHLMVNLFLLIMVAQITTKVKIALLPTNSNMQQQNIPTSHFKAIACFNIVLLSILSGLRHHISLKFPEYSPFLYLLSCFFSFNLIFYLDFWLIARFSLISLTSIIFVIILVGTGLLYPDDFICLTYGSSHWWQPLSLAGTKYSL